jgi:hypothetical protein
LNYYKTKELSILKEITKICLLICVPEFIEGHFENKSWWDMNGGQWTWETLSRLTDDEALLVVRCLNTLPDCAWYASPKGHKVFLTHAGTDLNYTKEHLEMIRGQAPYLWDRKHFFAKHPQDMKNVYQVHGHTPVQILREEYRFYEPKTRVITEVFQYCDGHKFDIDMCSFASGRTVLIDLDTFEVIYFDTTKGTEVL